MQTFLPYSDFAQSAKCLDMRRLGKQRVEVLQILRALRGYTQGWRNHPATLQWEGHENALVDYGIAVCKEWISRGYKDTCLDKIEALRVGGDTVMPSWLGMEKYHASHRSNLLRKDPDWYCRFGWSEGADLAYFWPTVETDKFWKDVESREALDIIRTNLPGYTVFINDADKFLGGDGHKGT